MMLIIAEIKILPDLLKAMNPLEPHFGKQGLMLSQNTVKKHYQIKIDTLD